jgi:hypothetical protein
MHRQMVSKFRLLFELSPDSDKSSLMSPLAYVRFGSLADMCAAISDVRYYPNSDRESRHAQTVMSALHSKADLCTANTDVCFGP